MIHAKILENLHANFAFCCLFVFVVVFFCASPLPLPYPSPIRVFYCLTSSRQRCGRTVIVIMGVVDRSKIFLAAFGEAMATAGIVRKVLHVIQLLSMMVFLVLPNKLGLSKGKTVVSQITEFILQIRYGATTSNSFSLSNKDKEVLVITPPPGQLIEAIRPAGKIAAVLVLDANHETHLSSFIAAVKKETGSRPIVIAVRKFLPVSVWFSWFLFLKPKSQRGMVEEADHVDEELETSATAKRFGFQRLISNQACREACGATDHLLLFKTPDNKNVLVGSCGFGNVQFEWTISSFISLVLGFVGAGVFRMYKWTFVANLDRYRRTWKEGIELKPDVFLPQHGEAIKSNVPERMKAFAI